MPVSNSYSTENAALGIYGADRISDTEVHEPASAPSEMWIVIEAVEDAVFGEGCEVKTGDAPEAGDALPAGQMKQRPFTKVQLQSGVVEAVRI